MKEVDKGIIKEIKEPNWTVDPETGRSNSSEKFESTVKSVEQLIKGCAHSLISGNTESVARLIVAQLAHKHGFAPESEEESH